MANFAARKSINTAFCLVEIMFSTRHTRGAWAASTEPEICPMPPDAPRCPCDAPPMPSENVRRCPPDALSCSHTLSSTLLPQSTLTSQLSRVHCSYIQLGHACVFCMVTGQRKASSTTTSANGWREGKGDLCTTTQTKQGLPSGAQ